MGSTQGQIRKRDPGFPISSGQKYDYDQPTAVAHVGTTFYELVTIMSDKKDTTLNEMCEEVRRRHGSGAEELLSKRVQWINIWKPLKGPLNDWPLTLCDASTVDRDQDFEAADLLYPDLATENSQIYHSDHYEWYYLSDHDPSELIIFKQADTLTGSCPGVPHCSFFNPLTPSDESPRESIEARALVYY
ncbi:MAG: hypothetical protein Q9160_002215 [Pyrenula sp. 1 TL-2023]